MEQLDGRRPLEGLRVLELGSLIAGPFATRLFADFGAEVIKVEAREGDPIRTWGRISPSGSSWWWHVQSRNKKLVCIDLRTPDGQQIVRELISKADVVVENFRPGRLAQWHLAYEDVCVMNPQIVYVSVSGFGQTGPYRERPGFGNIAESMGGLRYITGFPDRPPLRVGVSLGDEIAALYAVVGALLALLNRERSAGRPGDHVDVALTEAVFSLTEGSLTEFIHTGAIQERSGNQLHRTAPTNIYPTREGRWIAIGANSPTTFPRLLQAMNRRDLLHDPRYVDNRSRVENAEELDDLISAWTGERTMDELLALLTQAEVPAGPVMNVRDIAEDEQFRFRDMIVDVPSEQLGSVSMPGVVPKLRNHPGAIVHDGHEIGHDTDYVLTEILGWKETRVQELREAGVIL